MFENPDLIKAMAFENAKSLSAKDQCILAERYLFGKGVEKDLTMAFKLYELAAKSNFLPAKYNLANMYLKGQGTTKDKAKAIKIYEELAKQKYLDAIDVLAYYYYVGENVEPNPELALKMFKESATKGSAYAMFHLGKIYDEGKIVTQDLAEVKKYYELAAKKGLAVAMVNLGYMYEQGKGVEQDTSKAIEYYKKASEKGDEIADYNLGCAYFDGIMVEQDYEKSYNYLSKAVQKGFSMAKYSLGYMYYKGQGVEQNIDKARELFLEAAAEGEHQSCYMLGYMYNVGVGFEQDYKKAIQYYELAAKCGSTAAYSDLGFMYNQGRGVEVDNNKAIEYFKKGIELGDDASKCNMAVAYVNGAGVEKDIDKAIDILNIVNDTFINKFYFLGTLTLDIKNCEEKTKEVVNQAIDYYNKYIELYPRAEDKRYLPIIYYKLAECYLDLYYLDEANHNNRNKEHFLGGNVNREKAKEYIKLVKEHSLEIEGANVKNFKNDLQITEELLNDEGLNLSKYDYDSFKKEYFGKYEDIFLLTNKKEFDLFEDGIKFYFEKREKQKEIEEKIKSTEKNFEKRKPLIRKKLEELNVGNIEEKLEELRLEEIEKTKSIDTDFSNSVVNIDKYLEEILHYLFVDCLYDHKKDIYKQLISENIKEIKTSLNACSLERLKELNEILNGIDKNLNLNKEVLAKKVEIFAEKFNKNWQIKNVAEEKIAELNNYYENNKDHLDNKETTLISKMLENAKARTEFANTTKSDKFELGSLFYMAFVENSSTGIVPQKVVDATFVEFVSNMNKNMTQNEATFKLNELLLKIEMFRVIVRNVASHKSTLTQSAVEHGINISIVQENSIFKLLDELFGDFLNEKYVEQVVNGVGI